MKRTFIAVLLSFLTAFFLFPCTAFGRGRNDKTLDAIVEMAKSDNRVMVHEDFLANRIGGRPIGSHALEDAEKWVAEQFRSWGLEVMVQEVGEIGVGFRRGPWSGRLLSEDGMTLHFTTPTYTAGTRGPVRGKAVLAPSDARSLDRMKGLLKGAWVLVDGDSNGFPVKMDSLKTEIAKCGILGWIQSAPVPIQAHYDRAGCYDLTMETLPTICDIKLDHRQYEVIKTRLEAREEALLEFDIRNHFFAGPVKYHNIIAILRGAKHPDEYVLCGGHLDAYDIASGAVDDGQGVSVTMETARLLAACGAKPDRSIMFCIWTGEEYGLLGSKYFVENATVPLDKISNYFNRDGGPDCATMCVVPESMYDDFVKVSEVLATACPDFPFTVEKMKDTPRPLPTKAGGSDHAHFAMKGVPTISLWGRDIKGYGFNYRDIWHTDRDLYDKVIAEYLEQASLANAVIIYGIADLDHLLDRSGLYSEK